MTNPEITTNLANLEKEHEKYIAQYNEQFRAGKNLDAENTAALIERTEKQYNALSLTDFYQRNVVPENQFASIRNACTEVYYTVIGHKVKKDGSLVIGWEAVSRNKKVDLYSLCRTYKFETSWIHALEQFTYRLCLRTAQDVMSDKEYKRWLKVMQTTSPFAMRKLSRQVDLGDTPCSNTQIGKTLQSIVNLIAQQDETKSGDDFIKTNNKDVKFLVNGFSSLSSKELLGLNTAAPSKMKELFLRVMHRVVTNSEYGVGYRIQK